MATQYTRTQIIHLLYGGANLDHTQRMALHAALNTLNDSVEPMRSPFEITVPQFISIDLGMVA